jgi:hypothetical protein
MTGSERERSTNLPVPRPTLVPRQPSTDAPTLGLVESCRSALLNDTTPVTERLRLRHALRALIEEEDLRMLEAGGVHGAPRPDARTAAEKAPARGPGNGL